MILIYPSSIHICLAINVATASFVSPVYIISRLESQYICRSFKFLLHVMLVSRNLKQVIIRSHQRWSSLCTSGCYITAGTIITITIIIITITIILLHHYPSPLQRCMLSIVAVQHRCSLILCLQPITIIDIG